MSAMPPPKAGIWQAFQSYDHADIDDATIKRSTGPQVKHEPSKAEIWQSSRFWKLNSDVDHTFKRSPGLCSNPEKHESSKPDIWRSFQYFKQADIDLTFKRSPGLCADEVKHPPEPRTCRKRPESEPPPKSSPLARSWSFYNREDHTNYYAKGPKLGGRSAAETSYDKVSASLACDMFECHGFEERPTTKRGSGQFSPSTGSPTLTRSKSSHVRDFYERGVLDIDSNIQRGEQGRGGEVTLDKEEPFSEEIGFQLKQDIASLTETKAPSYLPNYVTEMKCLGIEHRRLASSVIREEQAQEGQPFNVLGSRQGSPRPISPRPAKMRGGHSVNALNSWQDLRKVQEATVRQDSFTSPSPRDRRTRQPSSSPRPTDGTPRRPSCSPRPTHGTPRVKMREVVRQTSNGVVRQISNGARQTSTSNGVVRQTSGKLRQEMVRPPSRGRLNCSPPLRTAIDELEITARSPRRTVFDLMERASVLDAGRYRQSSPPPKVNRQDSSFRLSGWMNEIQREMDEANVNSKRLAKAFSARGSLQRRSHEAHSKPAPVWVVDPAAEEERARQTAKAVARARERADEKMAMLQRQAAEEEEAKKKAEQERLAREAERVNATDEQYRSSIEKENIAGDELLNSARRLDGELAAAAKTQTCSNSDGGGIEEKHHELMKSEGSLVEEPDAAAGQKPNYLFTDGFVQLNKDSKSVKSRVDVEDGVVHLLRECETEAFPKLSFYFFKSSPREAGSNSERSTADFEEGSFSRSSLASSCPSGRTSQPLTPQTAR